MPKYLQDQFSIDASISAIICGAILLPAAGVGILGGGFVIRRFNLSMTGCSKMALMTSSLSACLMVPIFFFKCGNAPIAGVTVDYPYRKYQKFTYWVSSSYLTLDSSVVKIAYPGYIINFKNISRFKIFKILYKKYLQEIIKSLKFS